VGEDGAVEFGFDDLRDCKDFKVTVGGMVGDIPRRYVLREVLKECDEGGNGED
jgi:hypothetical protein